MRLAGLDKWLTIHWLLFCPRFTLHHLFPKVIFHTHDVHSCQNANTKMCKINICSEKRRWTRNGEHKKDTRKRDLNKFKTDSRRGIHGCAFKLKIPTLQYSKTFILHKRRLPELNQTSWTTSTVLTIEPFTTCHSNCCSWSLYPARTLNCMYILVSKVSKDKSFYRNQNLQL